MIEVEKNIADKVGGWDLEKVYGVIEKVFI